jgi:hypothetical protein
VNRDDSVTIRLVFFAVKQHELPALDTDGCCWLQRCSKVPSHTALLVSNFLVYIFWEKKDL